MARQVIVVGDTLAPYGGTVTASMTAAVRSRCMGTVRRSDQSLDRRIAFSQALFETGQVPFST